MTERVRAVKALQAALAVKRPEVRIDGVVGEKTRAAFIAAAPAVQQSVSAMMQSLTGQGVQSLLTAPTPVRVNGQLSKQQLLAIIRAERAKSPAQRYLTWLTDEEIDEFAVIESNRVPTAQNRWYKGLFAMGSPAWSDARTMDPSLPFFDRWSDPVINTRAALAYWGFIVRGARANPKAYVQIDTAQKLYGAHQQGLAGFTKLVRSNASLAQIREKRTGISVVDNQSRQSLIHVAGAVQQARA